MKSKGPGRPELGSAKRVPITVRLPPDLANWLASYANKKGRIIEEALRAFWRANP